METMSMQNLGGQTKSIMVFLKVAYDKDSKCKLKKYLFGNKTKESATNFATRRLLPIVP